MSQTQPTPQPATGSSVPAQRPTLVVTLPRLNDSRMAEAWGGVQAVCREQNADTICIPTGALNAEQHGRVHPWQMAVKRLLHSRRIDGIITVEFWRNAEWFRTFYAPYRPLPVVTILRHYPGDHGVNIDIAAGIRSEIRHLIEEHGCRRIVYLRGPAGNSAAEERCNVYYETLRTHGLPFDDRLVIPYGPGYVLRPRMRSEEGIRLLIEERGLLPGRDLDAIVAFNDGLASDILEILQERGISVPGDVALVGFDNRPEMAFLEPPLTTVTIPWRELGRQAATDMLGILRGEAVAEHAQVPAQLVTRESCGCPNRHMLEATRKLSIASRSDNGAPDRFQSLHVALSSLLTQYCADSQGWAPRLISAWKQDFTAATASEPDQECAQSDSFLAVLKQWLLHEAEQKATMESGHSVVSLMRRHLLPISRDEAVTAEHAEDLWQQARILIDHLSEQRLRRKQQEAQHHKALVRDLEQQVIHTFDLARMMELLSDGLPGVGLEQCYVSLYDSWDTMEDNAFTGWADQSILMLARNHEEAQIIANRSSLYSEKYNGST